jgi:antitoxin component YwqK of YwqJK toxin-antitoxin module
MAPEPEPKAEVPSGPSTEGPFTLYDELGRATEEGFMRNGMLDGELRIFARGRIAARYRYREGVRHGAAQLYNEAGDMIAEGTYQNDLHHGEWAYFDDRGNVARRVLYSAGDLQGRAVAFYASGKPREFCDYNNGLRDGEMLTYSEQGKLIDRRYFRAGRPVDALDQ